MELIEEKIQISVGPPPKKSKVIKIIAGVIILIAIGVGVCLYTKAWDPFWNPFRPSPEEVIEKMVIEMGELKAVHSRAEMSIEAKEDTKEGFKISMDFASDSDNTDPKNPKSAGDFYITLAFEGMQFSLAGESKTIGEDSYFKLTTIPALAFLEPFFEMLGIDLGEIKGQWIKFDMAEETQKAKEEQEEMIQKFQTLFKDKKLYIVTREFADKEIRNVKTYHYLVALNKEEIKKLIPGIFEILWEAFPPSNLGFPMTPSVPGKEEILTEILEAFDEFFEKVGEITAELWIGKKDNLLYKIKGEKEIDLAEINPGTEGKIIIKIDMDFSDFNQPLIIEAPEEFKTIEEIFSPFLEEFFKISPSTPFQEPELEDWDTRGKTELLQLQTLIESDYEKYGYSQFGPGPMAFTPGENPCAYPYQWISNIENPQKYCVWICLEGGRFFAISHKGNQELDNPPINLDCW
ncbi:hypothetical protein KJA14_01440 [Patescibacteria group bacterium]|nr:hypothetical protein [Patescibacteria group bacterium]